MGQEKATTFLNDSKNDSKKSFRTGSQTGSQTGFRTGSQADSRTGAMRRPASDFITLICPCHFGLESVLKREITDLGYEVDKVEDGKVSFLGDWQAVCYANVFLRSAERVLVKAGSFHAETFEDLFQGTRAIEWERYLPRDAKFWVAKATSVRSKLFSPRDIQAIMKKAMV